ncbi:hypothetical protein [Mesorhizobium sp. SP-1A]|uniref:hypothetical protein n=1 Tax=Mesorhizobium sp. SP-1A TaxID=3077840 RepID=UPI0028F7157E|nr:hypothetical protein [Mesorhizobium sp. SP-1A]
MKMSPIKLVAISLIGGAPVAHTFAPINFASVTSIGSAIDQFLPFFGYHVLGAIPALGLVECISRLRRQNAKRERTTINA